MHDTTEAPPIIDRSAERASILARLDPDAADRDYEAWRVRTGA